MKIFKNKFLVKLIASICIFLTLFNFTGTSKVYAEDDGVLEEWGGVLIAPIIDLMTAIADFIMNIMHEQVQEQNHIFIHINGDPAVKEILATILAWVIGIFVAAVVIWFTGAIGGLIAAKAAALLGTVASAAPFVVSIGTVVAGAISGIVAGTAIKESIIPNDIDLPLFSITAEKIFSNQIALCDVNFFNPNDYEIQNDDGSYEERQSIAEQLQEIISTWYFILRNLALLVLMLLLIYAGIRIVIGSTAGEKAKYKERLTDWLVAICLVFIMHYIMVFAVEIVERLTDFIGTTTNGNAAYIQLTEHQRKDAEEQLEGFDTTGDGDAFDDSSGAGPHGAIVWPTDLAGLFKIRSQTTEDGTFVWAGYALSYAVLVLFTVFFLFTYIRRVLYMAFLTIIAPLVAMTYPFDKMTDGKAQAFDSWLKEYLFNLMIQPLHLILYTILVSSAYALASESSIYALVALGFMMPAEKLMRNFFGFKKAQTPGLLGGAAGAAIAMSGMQSLLKHKPSGGKDGGYSGGKSTDQSKVKFANKNPDKPMDAIAGGKPTETTVEEQPQRIVTNPQTPLANDDSDELRFAQSNYEMDEDDILSNTTLENNDWEHDRFNKNNDAPKITDNKPEVKAPAVRTAQQPDSISLGYDKAKDTKAKRIRRAAGVVGKQVVGKTLTGMHPLKLGGRIALGATAATAGMLLGIASGDPKQTFQNVTAGAIAGSALAKSMSGNKLSQADVDEIQMAYYGEDYKEEMIKKQKKEFQEDISNINYLRKTMGVDRKQAEKILKTTGSDCFDKGITNIEDIATIHKLTTGKDALSPELAVAARNYAKKRLPADTDSLTEEEIESRKARWANEYKKAGYVKSELKKVRDKDGNEVKDKKTGKTKMERVYDEEQARALADKSFDLAIKFNKAKSSLTKHPTSN